MILLQQGIRFTPSMTTARNGPLRSGDRMNGVAYEALVVDGLIHLPSDVHLPNNLKVFVVVPSDANERAGQVSTPRLVHPEQIADFELDVREIPDARV